MFTHRSSSSSSSSIRTSLPASLSVSNYIRPLERKRLWPMAQPAGSPDGPTSASPSSLSSSPTIAQPTAPTSTRPSTTATHAWLKGLLSYLSNLVDAAQPGPNSQITEDTQLVALHTPDNKTAKGRLLKNLTGIAQPAKPCRLLVVMDDRVMNFPQPGSAVRFWVTFNRLVRVDIFYNAIGTEAGWLT